MIDISQLTASAPNTANAANATNTSKADNGGAGFGDALARARDGNANAKPAATAGNDAKGTQQAERGTSQANDAKAPDAATTQNGGSAGPAAASGKPAGADKDKAADQAAQATAGTAPDGSALAALAAAQLLPVTPQAPLPAGQAQADTVTGGDAATLPAAAPGDTGASTLALIASQRAAMQGGASVASAVGGDDAGAIPLPTALEGKPRTPADTAAAGKHDALQALTASQAGKTRVDTGANAQGAGLQPPADSTKLAAQPAPQTPATAAAAQPKPAASTSADTPRTDAAAALAAAAGAPTTAPLAPTQSVGLAAATPLALSPPVGDAQWPQALGQQMVRLSTQGNHTAELDLNPPNLGPLKVVLNVVNDQAQAQFVSPHQAVRAAVEAALPQLRTSLAESGIQLGHTSVGADSFAGQAGNGQPQQQRQPSGSGFSQMAGLADTATVATATAAPVPRAPARGEIDTFA